MAAITVRLSEEDHKLLQLYCVATGKSQQTVLTDLLRAELDRALPGKREALGRPGDPDAMWRAIGVTPPAPNPDADAWAQGVIDSLRDDDGAGQAAA